MTQIKLNTIQIVLMAHYEKLLIQIIHMALICENDMIQIKDMFQIVAMWLQFSTEEYVKNKYKPSLNMVKPYRTVPIRYLDLEY